MEMKHAWFTLRRLPNAVDDNSGIILGRDRHTGPLSYRMPFLCCYGSDW